MASKIVRYVNASADIIGCGDVVVLSGGCSDVTRVLESVAGDEKLCVEVAGVEARRWRWLKKKRAMETELVAWVEGNPYSR
jgi:hypothetical protein